MNEDVVERCDNFNTKGCTYEPLFGDFHDRPIPPVQYDLLNDYDGDDNNIPVTPGDDVFKDNKGVGYAVVQNAPVTDDNDEDIDNQITIEDYDSLTSFIDLTQN